MRRVVNGKRAPQNNSINLKYAMRKELDLIQVQKPYHVYNTFPCLSRMQIAKFTTALSIKSADKPRRSVHNL